MKATYVAILGPIMATVMFQNWL